MNYTETVDNLSATFIFGYLAAFIIFITLMYFLFKWTSGPISDITKRIEKFKKDINNQKGELALFNFWAFCFSSFYFWYVGLSWRFILFLVLPWLFMLPFVFLSDPATSFLIGFTISHLIAGFTSNRLCQKYKQNYILKHKDADPIKPVLYRPISIKKIIVMNFLTAGLYSIYWSYKNWHSYQVETKDDVNPFFRSWLYHLTMYDLFSKMTRTMKLKKSYAKYGFLFFVFSSLDLLLNRFFESNEFSIEVQGLFALISLFIPILIALICLVPVQKIINQYAKKAFKQKIDTKFYPGEVAWLILGLLLNFVILFGNPFIENQQNKAVEKSVLAQNFQGEELDKVSASLGFIYRHVNGYADVCLKENYEMQKYPNDFIELLQDDILKLKTRLEEKGISLEQAMDEVKTQPEFVRLVHQSVYAELDQLKRTLIVENIAEQQNVPVDNIEWNDDLDNLLSFQDICQAFDEVGIDLLKNNEIRYFLKANF